MAPTQSAAVVCAGVLVLCGISAALIATGNSGSPTYTIIEWLPDTSTSAVRQAMSDAICLAPSLRHVDVLYAVRCDFNPRYLISVPSTEEYGPLRSYYYPDMCWEAAVINASYFSHLPFEPLDSNGTLAYDFQISLRRCDGGPPQLFRRAAAQVPGGSSGLLWRSPSIRGAREQIDLVTPSDIFIVDELYVAPAGLAAGDPLRLLVDPLSGLLVAAPKNIAGSNQARDALSRFRIDFGGLRREAVAAIPDHFILVLGSWMFFAFVLGYMMWCVRGLALHFSSHPHGLLQWGRDSWHWLCEGYQRFDAAIVQSTMELRVHNAKAAFGMALSILFLLALGALSDLWDRCDADISFLAGGNHCDVRRNGEREAWRVAEKISRDSTFLALLVLIPAVLFVKFRKGGITARSLDGLNIILSLAWVVIYCRASLGWHIRDEPIPSMLLVQGIIFGNARLSSLMYFVVSMISFVTFKNKAHAGDAMHFQPFSLNDSRLVSKVVASVLAACVFYFVERASLREMQWAHESHQSMDEASLAIRLLSGMCDAIVRLDSCCVVLGDAASLSALLAHGSSLEGVHFSDLIAADSERQTFLEHLPAEAAQDGYRVRPFPITLRGGAGAEVRIEVHFASVARAEGAAGHLLGINVIREEGTLGGGRQQSSTATAPAPDVLGSPLVACPETV